MTISQDGRIKVGAVQWEARDYGSFDQFCAAMEGNIRALAAYQPDFVLFPEYFTLCLAAQAGPGDDHALLAFAAGFSQDLLTRCTQWAQKYKINLIAGSMPVQEADGLYNICYLCHRDGRVDAYRKTHLTPFEHTWKMKAGNTLQAFETDCGTVGMLICYDVEFPEAARSLALDGAKVLFVPYQTDTVHGYYRVKRCAQARAIENELYVITAGLTGNMPQLPLVEFQYACAGIFTPSDHYFPTGGVQLEATVNIPTGIYAELDMPLLSRLHTAGSVRTMADRRPELYRQH